VLDSGESEAPPPTDGALSVTVVDLQGDAQPELVLSLLSSYDATPERTWVLKLTPKGVQSLGAATALRRAAAVRLRQDRPPVSRHLAELLLRLEPKSQRARFELLAATRELPAQPNWWGFYAPGSNNDLALHATVFAHKAAPTELRLLDGLPLVARWLTRKGLTVEDLAQTTDPLLPLSLWGSANTLEPSQDTKVFSYFFFDCEAAAAAGEVGIAERCSPQK
jgi:hypothetical protein